VLADAPAASAIARPNGPKEKNLFRQGDIMNATDIRNEAAGLPDRNEE